jgi:hypothetical protein
MSVQRKNTYQFSLVDLFVNLLVAMETQPWNGLTWRQHIPAVTTDTTVAEEEKLNAQ